MMMCPATQILFTLLRYSLQARKPRIRRRALSMSHLIHASHSETLKKHTDVCFCSYICAIVWLRAARDSESCDRAVALEPSGLSVRVSQLCLRLTHFSLSDHTSDERADSVSWDAFCELGLFGFFYKLQNPHQRWRRLNHRLPLQT